MSIPLPSPIELGREDPCNKLEEGHTTDRCIITLFANPLSMANRKKVWLLDLRGHMLPVEEVKSSGKRSGILGSETSFSCFAVHQVANQPVNQQHRLVQSTISTMKVHKAGSKKASRWGISLVPRPLEQ